MLILVCFVFIISFFTIKKLIYNNIINEFKYPYIESTRAHYIDIIPSYVSEKEFWNYKIDNTTPNKELFKKGELNYKRYKALIDIANKLKVENVNEFLYKNGQPYNEFSQNLSELEITIINTLMKDFKNDKNAIQFYNNNKELYKRSDIVKGTVDIMENDVVTYSFNINYDDSNARIISENYNDAYNILETIGEGESKKINDSSTGLEYVVKCISKVDGGFVPYDEIKNTVMTNYLNDKLNLLIDKSINNENIDDDISKFAK